MIELKIMFDPKSGQMSVNGPLDNRGLCYMLLELARDQIREFDHKKAAGAILVADAAAVHLNGLGFNR